MLKVRKQYELARYIVLHIFFFILNKKVENGLDRIVKEINKAVLLFPRMYNKCKYICIYYVMGRILPPNPVLKQLTVSLLFCYRINIL